MLALLLLAFAVRLPYLWTIPRFTDETAEVALGLRVARGEILPLTNVDPYIGALWSYLLAVGFAIGGPSLYSPRLLTGLLGALTVLPAYLLGRSLCDGNRLGGFVAGLLLALAPMHIVVNSHIAWSNCLTPLFTTTGLWLTHRAVRQNRPRLLAPGGLAFGLGLQTHPVGALLLPGVAVAVAIARPRWLRGPWPWLAIVAAMLGAANLLAANVWGGSDSLAAGNAVQAGYTGNEVLTPAVYAERARLTLWLLTDSLGGALAESGTVGGPFAPTLGAKVGLILLATTALGVEARARRQDALLFCALISYTLLLPLVNGRYEAAVPKARYVTPLLPVCFAAAAVAMTSAQGWIERRAARTRTAAERIGGRRPIRLMVDGLLAPGRLGLALGAGVTLLVLAPLANLVGYYQSAVQQGRTNDTFFQVVAGIEASRRPGDPVYGERGALVTYTLGGGRWLGHLLLAAQVYGWEQQILEPPHPDAQIVPGMVGPLVVRAPILPLMARLYRLDPVAAGPPDGAPMRLVYARGTLPNLLGATRQDQRDDIPQPPRPPRVEPFVGGVERPSALRFAPDGRLFFNEEQAGRVRIASASGELQGEPFVTLPTPKGLDQGALGLALDPAFPVNHWVYVLYSEADAENRPVRNRLVRFTERDGLAAEATAILDNLPVNQTPAFNGGHNGGRITFGADGKLYVSVGEVNQPGRAPDPTALYGKILRLNPDGTIPSDNPFRGSPVYAMGFRDVLGLAIHPGSGQLYATDSGLNGFDELNLIRAGRDYGYPSIDGGPDEVSGLEDPIWDSGEEQVGVTGLTVYTGWLFPEYAGDIFFCSSETGALRRARLRGSTLNQVEWVETIARDCRLDVTNGPGGTLYFSDLARIFRLAR